jgi:hypothetical protein
MVCFGVTNSEGSRAVVDPKERDVLLRRQGSGQLGHRSDDRDHSLTSAHDNGRGGVSSV